ncbi:MAG: sodium-dependent transporter, partial [Bacteroidota bacterium]
AFILVYLACILLIGIPIFIAEIYIGRKYRANVVAAFPRKEAWFGIGPFALLSAVAVLAIYCVIGGWVLDFDFRAVAGGFSGEGEMVRYDATPIGQQLAWTGLFYAICIAICAAGVQKGIEAFNRILIPLLIVLVFVLTGRALFLDGAGEASAFLFQADFSQLTGDGILEAIGHAFFTLSVGFGAILTYGAYLPENSRNLPQIAFIVAAFDTLIALLMGVIIFSIGFSDPGFEPASGPTLIFDTLPRLFGATAGGQILAIVFFTLVGFAAITSAISLLEIIISVVQERLGWARRKATFLTGLLMFVVSGIVIAFYRPVFSWIDGATTNYMLPIGGILLSVYVGWRLGPTAIAEIFNGQKGPVYHVLLWILRVVAPVAVATVILL